MLIAYNNDIEFRSRWYHIQTEDNGIKDGHVTTTVFHSGQILDSKSVSYKDSIAGVQDQEKINSIIKDIMIKQHQLFYTKLYDGHYEAQMQEIVSHTSAQASGRPASQQLNPVPAAASGLSPRSEGVRRDSATLDNSGFGASGKKPDILRASQQMTGVTKGLGIKSLATLSKAPAQIQQVPVNANQPVISNMQSSISLNRVSAGERIPVMNTPVPISRAVLREESTRKNRAWKGFNWPVDDLAIDSLVVSLLENA